MIEADIDAADHPAGPPRTRSPAMLDLHVLSPCCWAQCSAARDRPQPFHCGSSIVLPAGRLAGCGVPSLAVLAGRGSFKPCFRTSLSLSVVLPCACRLPSIFDRLSPSPRLASPLQAMSITFLIPHPPRTHICTSRNHVSVPACLCACMCMCACICVCVL